MPTKEVLKPGKPVSGIRHHGTVCKGCGFDFEKTYGDLGKDFIHVHHITPLKTITECYKRAQFGYRKLLYVKVIFCTSELW